MVALLYFDTMQSVNTFESEVRNLLSALEPSSMDSLCHQHHAKSVSTFKSANILALCQSKTTLPMCVSVCCCSFYYFQNGIPVYHSHALVESKHIYVTMYIGMCLYLCNMQVFILSSQIPYIIARLLLRHSMHRSIPTNNHSHSLKGTFPFDIGK